MQASIADPSPASKEEFLLLERKLLDLAFGKVKFSVISALLLASLIVIALWSVIEHERLLAWLAGMAVVKVLHFLYLHRYRRHGHRADVAPGAWKNGLVVGAAAAGLGWGSAVFCFPSSPFNPVTLFGVFVLPSTPFDPVTVLLIFTLAGITAYASVAMAFVPLAAFAFFACAWLPLAIWLFSFGEQMYVAMGLIALSYLGAMVMLSRRMHATVRGLISATEENRGLRTAQQENDWRMQRFFESAPGFFYSACMTPDGKSAMPFASAGIVELFDIAAEEVAESMSPLFALVRAEDIELVIKAREASRRNLSPFHIEFRINHPVKGERWIELHSLPKREPDGSTNWHGFMQDVTGRKRLEEQLYARERDFRTLAENSPNVVIRYDIEGRRVYANKALAALAGKKPEELVGQLLWDDTPLLDPEAYAAKLRKVVANRQPSSIELAAQAATGEVLWYQGQFVPEFDEDGNVGGVLMVAGDITGRRRMEQEQQRRETEFRTLAENLPVAVIRYDAEQRRRYINPAAERMLHGTSAELLGQVPGEGGVPATSAMIEHYRGKMEEVLAADASRELEFVLDELPIDEREHYEVRFVPEHDADGHTAGVLAIWHDITERKRMENEMRQQANFRQTLLDAISEVGLQLMVIEEGRINYASNLEISREFGYGEEEIAAGVPLMDIVHPDDRARVMDYYVRRAAGEASPNSYELSLVTKRGERREYETSVSVLAGTSPLRIVSVGKDITERKRMEEELRLKESVLDQAHDGVYLIDENARFVYVNDEACRALGYSRNELLAMGVGDIDYAESNESSLAVRQKTLEEGAYSFETQHRRRDGSLFPVEIQASTLVYQGKQLGLALARDITERKAVERSLHDSERMLQEAQRIAHVGSWDVDMVNDRLVWSDEIFRIWEIDKAKFKADFAAFLETVHPEDRERVNRVYHESVANHTFYEVEHRLLFPDGRVKHILERGEPQYDARGKPVRFIGTSLDITELKRMEDKLAAREREFRSLSENLPDNIARWDTEGRYLYINPTHERTLGATLGEVVGTAISDSHEQVKTAIAQVAASGKPLEVMQRADVNGDTETHVVNLVPEFDADGKVVSVLGLGRDLTKIYRLQDEIAAREQLLRTVIDATPDWIFIKDSEHRYQLVNQGYADALHLTPEDFIGKNDLDLGFPEELVKGNPEQGIRGFWADDRRVLDSNETHVFPEDPATIDGVVHTFHTIKVPLQDADGKAWGVLAFARDITSRKLIEQDLRTSEALAQSRNELLQAIVESSPEIIVFALDANYRYLSFNQKHKTVMQAIWGKEIAVGMSMLDAIGDHPDRESAQHGMDRALAGESFVLEEAYGDEARSRQYWLNYWSPIRAATGKVVGLTCFVLNVTERKQAEVLLKEKFEKIAELNDYLEENARTLEEHAVELEATQEQLKEALEFSNGVINAIPDILFEMDREGRYHGVWTQHPELLAAQKVLLLNKTVHEVLPPEAAATALDAIREADENGAAYGKVIAIPQANGEVKWFEHSISRKQGSLPADARFIVLSRDVTERQRSEEVLRFIAQGEWMQGGESFLNTLVRYLGKSLGVDYVVIDKFADEPGYVETVARYVKGEIAPNVRYALQSTPCGEVAAGAECCHGENIQGRFPESSLLKDMRVESYVGIPLLDIEGGVIGLIAVLNEQPLGGTHFVKSVLQMVSSSVTAELMRSRMEQVLRENYDALNEAQRISNIGNWELDLASGALLWSDEIYRIFEIDPERFGASYDAFINVIHPDDREAVNCAYSESLASREPYEVEHRLLFADGRIKYVHERCETHYAEDGKPLRSLGTVQDITARKRAEESLRESYDKITELNRHLETNAQHLEENARHLEEQTTELEASQEQLKQTEAWYRSILHSAPEGMLVVDDHGLIMQVNARLEAMFGYESGELPGHRVETLLPQAVRKSHAGQRAGYFASGATNHPAMVGKTLFGCRKDGSTFPVDVSLARLPELDGRRSAVCASVRDITERQAMEAAREAALAEAQRLAQLRSAFMAQMSHELRTPLNGILGYAQNLLQDEALAEKQLAGLSIIQHSGEHLLSLINGLLDHAAIEANKFELIEGDIELDPFLGAIIGIIRVRAEQKNLAFTCEAGSDLPAVVRGDAQRLRQVLINLLANAVKFTDRGDVILRVRLVASSRIRFEVQDSGVGIAADQLENIFLPFEQTGEIQRRAGGSGLGLAISRTLVRLMGGDISVESQPGGGSTFSFEIDIGIVKSDLLGIDAAALSERAATRVAHAAQMLTAPPRRELDTLHRLALRGSMRDVMRHADRLAEAEACYRPFAAQLRQLAQSFQTKALLGLIEQYRDRQEEE